MSHTVPLVMYMQGERIVVGDAEIDGDVITGVIDASDPEVANRLKLDVEHYSIGVFPSRDVEG